MKNFNVLLVFGLALSLLSCESGEEERNDGFSIQIAEKRFEFQLQDTLQASIKNLNQLKIDSVQYFFENQKLASYNGNEPFNLVFEDQKLGNQNIKAVVFSEGEKYEFTKSIKLFNNEKPKLYTYEVVEAYPHDPKAYTQGLEFYNDTLYESTGQNTRSSLRKVDFKTGEVLQKHQLKDEYFGEGITILNDKIYQLTWRSGKGLIYDLQTFEQLGTFAYNKSEEGWGLTNNQDKIFKSDGTEKIWILDPETLAEEDYIQVATNNSIVVRMNELEWVNGKIYANTYQKDGVAIINPENGAIEGLIDFRGLREQLGNEAQLDPLNDVLNGIAYNPITEKLYVTGKDWDTLFEVKIKEK